MIRAPGNATLSSSSAQGHAAVVSMPYDAMPFLCQLSLDYYRKLAAHVLENAPAGTGFNAVHIEVLNVDNDADLKCMLRANMCTKKPFANDLVTPIHCASINPNVKYLKTLLSITQDFNIADKKGRKPVHFAAVCEGPSPLEYLISRVSPYELDHMGNTPLHYACLANRSMNVEILLNFAQKKQEDDSALTSEMLIDNKYGFDLNFMTQFSYRETPYLKEIFYFSQFFCFKNSLCSKI